MWKKILGGMVAIGLVIGISLGSHGIAEEEDTDLAACWHFDEGEGDIVKDSSGNDNDGTIIGATWVEGINGKALKFDGKDDYVDCGAGESLNITDKITIEAWVKPNVDGTWNGIVYKNFYAYVLQISDANNYNRFMMIVGDKNSKNIPRAESSASPYDGKWTHVVGTFNGNTVYLYINGVLKGFCQVEPPVVPIRDSAGKYLRIGYQFFNGIIDEVRIYKRALTKNEIISHYKEFSESVLG